MLHEGGGFYLGGAVIPPVLTDKITGSLNSGDTVYLLIDTDKEATIKFADNSTVTSVSGSIGLESAVTAPSTGAVEITFPASNVECSLMSEFVQTKLRGDVVYDGNGGLSLDCTEMGSLVADSCLNLSLYNAVIFSAEKAGTLYVSYTPSGGTDYVGQSIAEAIRYAALESRAAITYSISGVSESTFEIIYDGLYGSGTYDTDIAALVALGGVIGFA